MDLPDFLQHAALRLTSARDGETLVRTYLELVREITGTSRVGLYEAHAVVDVRTGTRSARRDEVRLRRVDSGTDSIAREPIDPDGVLRCLASGAPVVLGRDAAPGSDQGRVVLPVPGSNNPRRVVTLDDPAATPVRRVALLQVTELFGNQSILLDERERDALTGLLNRHALNQRFLSLSAPYPGAAHPDLWLALLDIDHFKRVNDDHGHLLGDEVLMQMARLLENSFRFTDAVFRYGGEEFVVLLRGDSTGPSTVLERFRAQVERHVFPRVGRVTVSIGYVHVVPGLNSPAAIDAADRALYRAKRSGRNRVVADTATACETIERTGEIEMF
ncbi:MAG: GGDEF domain-containing protein [Gammaproteobacteria bacterium]